MRCPFTGRSCRPCAHTHRCALDGQLQAQEEANEASATLTRIREKDRQRVTRAAKMSNQPPTEPSPIIQGSGGRDQEPTREHTQLARRALVLLEHANTRRLLLCGRHPLGEPSCLSRALGRPECAGLPALVGQADLCTRCAAHAALRVAVVRIRRVSEPSTDPESMG
jgi:hypothetical protein